MSSTVGEKHLEHLINTSKPGTIMKEIKLVFCDFGQPLVLITFLSVLATAALTPVN